MGQSLYEIYMHKDHYILRMCVALHISGVYARGTAKREGECPPGYLLLPCQMRES